MATIEDWNKYLGVVQELALVENDLRAVALDNTLYDAPSVAQRILFERF